MERTAEQRARGNATAKRARDRKRGIEVPLRRSGPVTQPISVGDKFGLLQTIEMVTPPNRAEKWRCICLCGCQTERTVEATYLRKNKIKSCHTRALTDEQRHRRLTQPRPCFRCQNVFPPEEFLDVWSNECRECRSKHRTSKTLRNNFGMSMDDYNQILSKQNGACAICGCPPPTEGRVRRLHIDHDHQTGLVRGLLCNACNAGIGHLKDSLELLQKAVYYLKNHLTTTQSVQG